MAHDLPTFHSISVPPSLKEMAFEVIKDSVIANKLTPEAVYSEQAIARELGISKTPVREALINLASKGFVTILPRRGFTVNTLTEGHIREIFEFRHALERAVVLHITPTVTEQSIHDLEKINSRTEKTRDRKAFIKLDRQFHRSLASLTINRYIIDALENIWDLCEWVATVVYHVKGRPMEAVKEHKAITEMLKRHDSAGTAAAMEEHLRITEMRFLSRMGT
ncbi:MAG: GntR family transcriptional regulator [Deltaproteobacteria bacterium]|nr:GntR family transcriptional regulator [Deltaproteobacteria bacterium]